MSRKLTVRKQAWVDRRKPDLLRGNALAPNASVAIRYQEKLDSLITRMVTEVHNELHRLFNDDAAQEFFAEDASIASQSRMVTNALKKKFDGLFGVNAKWIAESFANQSDAASSKAVNMSLSKLTGGLSLPTAAMKGPLADIFKATVHENVSLIKSIPQKYLSGVEQAVSRSITTGNGLKDLVPYLQKHKNITYARAKMISLDQTRKAFQNMGAERCERLGVTEAELVHVPSNHPRKTHIEANGTIYEIKKGFYDSAVKRYVKPGELPNCKCMGRPVIRLGNDDD